MNLVTAAKMLVLLEQSQHSGIEDHAYFIILHALKAELSKANDPEVIRNARQEFIEPNVIESNLWFGGRKVDAIKMYRERTGFGLYESKKALEAAELKHAQAILKDSLAEEFSRITSCG